jgi:NAD(P)-dependent dehydrogenase (short-subunit alcohol dehydrogenase family)
MEPSMNRLFSVNGKSALVTGGSSGIGEMIVRGFVDAGVKVYLVSRKVDACKLLAEELRDSGGAAMAPPADLSSEEGCRTLAREFASRAAKLDILVNSAGAAWGGPSKSSKRQRGNECSLSMSRAYFTRRSSCYRS